MICDLSSPAAANWLPPTDLVAIVFTDDAASSKSKGEQVSGDTVTTNSRRSTDGKGWDRCCQRRQPAAVLLMDVGAARDMCSGSIFPRLFLAMKGAFRTVIVLIVTGSVLCGNFR